MTSLVKFVRNLKSIYIEDRHPCVRCVTFDEIKLWGGTSS